MTRIGTLDTLPARFRHSAVAIGNFDGVHLGHARIIRRLATKARQLGGPAVVLTFDPHPAEILRPDHAPLPLTWIDRKCQLLNNLGVDLVITYPTDEAFLKLSAIEFFRHFVRDRLDARAMVEGPNFFFGHDRQGNVEMLESLCRQDGIDLEVVNPVDVDGQIVSSSRIRQLISQGRVDSAHAMLGRPYRIRGTIIHGAGRGAELGFPTANLDSISTLLPAEGIYAGRALVDDQHWPAAMNIGGNPTFDVDALKIEVHLIDFDGTLYDRPIEVDFLARLRNIKRFESVETLIDQLNIDIQQTRRIVVRPGCSS